MESFSFEVSDKFLDEYGHVNHAAYLEIFELARWDYFAKRGYSRNWVIENQKGPVVLEATVKYKKEVLAKDNLYIETTLSSHEKSYLMQAHQKMYKGENKLLASEISLLFGMMDLKERKLIKIEGEFAEHLYRD